ncbi:MAG: hypothetical protein HYY96_17635 [Candidatus Tectomicrobia bacterium]|nr:hypothetical protein [Candidatus Tectomicrobia bacterium]
MRGTVPLASLWVDPGRIAGRGRHRQTLPAARVIIRQVREREARWITAEAEPKDLDEGIDDEMPEDNEPELVEEAAENEE